MTNTDRFLGGSSEAVRTTSDTATQTTDADQNVIGGRQGGTHLAIVRQGSVSSLQERVTPDPAPGELVIAPEKVALCGTDIQIVRGDRDDPSPIVGHEGAGQITAIGDGVDDLSVGDRVVVNPTHPGDPSFLLGHNVDGLFQQRVLIAASAVAGGLVARIGDEISSSRATLIEPWAVTNYALRAMASEKPDTLLVIGDGLIGNLAAYLAPRILGADTVRVIIHRTEQGVTWSQKFLPESRGRRNDTAWEQECGERVALLVATHRGGTTDAIDGALHRLGSRVVAVHPIGGVAPGSVCALLPGVDPVGLRAAGTGGPWPPVRLRFSGNGLAVALTGNRGVTTEQLQRAAEELADEDESVDQLLTHDVDIEQGIEIFNALCADGSHSSGGGRVVRLVITLNPNISRV